jgi:N-methylhydantoinase A
MCGRHWSKAVGDARMAWRIGVDSGGTFTDVCLFNDETGVLAVWKVPSTPDDPSLGIAAGVAAGLERVDAPAESITYFGHGTTVATNALIQHRGAKTGLITTDGFRDLLEIGRQKRPDLYDIQVDKPVVLVTRDLRMEVPERIRHDGSVEVPLDRNAVQAAIHALKAAEVEAVAVCFLYGFVSEVHEAIVVWLLEQAFPEAFLSVSHAVAPEFREFERLSTTVVNAYLGPVMRKYIQLLAGRLAASGMVAAPHLTQSNGGVLSFEQAAKLPVRTVLSGPSTGVVGAREVGRQAGYADLITFDMGGTSSDVALLSGGQCRLASEAVIHGYPIKAPMLDIHTVGAGGGSIAFVDGGGLLKVGPRSAGAVPGPVCYGYGATEPTVTDANVVLGTLNPTTLLGGRMPVRRDLAVQAVSVLAERLRLDMMETAQGIVSVVTANMARAIRVISVQRGYDPRDYALLAFGGAGPLHAARLARELEIGRVLVPVSPGILCATGLLLTDLRTDFASTRLTVLDDAAGMVVEDAFATLTARANAWFDSEGISADSRQIVRTVDMRYAGQNYELAIAMQDDLGGAFAAAHRQLYGFAVENEPVQLVTFRVEASGIVPKAAFSPQPDAGPDAGGAIVGHRRVWLPEAGGFADCPVYERSLLRAGNRFSGPAVIEQMDATTLVLPDMDVRVEPFLNLILEMV